MERISLSPITFSDGPATLLMVPSRENLDKRRWFRWAVSEAINLKSAVTNSKPSADKILAPELSHSQVPKALWDAIPENAYEKHEERRYHIDGEVQ